MMWRVLSAAGRFRALHEYPIGTEKVHQSKVVNDKIFLRFPLSRRQEVTNAPRRPCFSRHALIFAEYHRRQHCAAPREPCVGSGGVEMTARRATSHNFFRTTFTVDGAPAKPSQTAQSIEVHRRESWTVRCLLASVLSSLHAAKIGTYCLPFVQKNERQLSPNRGTLIIISA